MRTYSPKQGEIERQWHIIDASDVVLGRLATHVATLLRGKHKAPEETTNFAHTQRPPSPRVALNAARLLGVRWDNVFFGVSSGGRWAARSTVNSAYAHMASVIWRYHPVQLRTSY